MPLDGFNTTILMPSQFREILKLTFGIVLSSTELGAMVRYFSEDGDSDNVVCTKFLKHYNLIRRIEKVEICIFSYLIFLQE